MVATLKVDLAALRDAATALGQVVNELDNAQANVNGLGDAVGHAGLAARLGEFTESWRVKREELAESTRVLASYVRQTADGFTDADHDLMVGITQGGQP